jgi:hypothetical protein
MARRNTIYGAYDTSLGDEINRMLTGVKELGIREPTKLEITALIAEKNQKAKMTKLEVFKFFERIRGVQR